MTFFFTYIITSIFHNADSLQTCFLVASALIKKHMEKPLGNVANVETFHEIRNVISGGRIKGARLLVVDQYYSISN